MRASFSPLLLVLLGPACLVEPSPDVGSGSAGPGAPSGEPGPAPGELAPGGIRLEDLPRQWAPVAMVNGRWELPDPCAPTPDITVVEGTFSAKGCTGPVVGSDTMPDGIVVRFTAAGAEVRATFHWLDREAGIGEWSWGDCGASLPGEPTPVSRVQVDKAPALRAPDVTCPPI